MPPISASSVMELKNRTNAGMMECKKALVEADGNVDKAVELLREWGVAKGAAPKSSEMKEGLVAARISDDGKLGVLVRLGCQTDFVARNEMFTKLLSDIVSVAFHNKVTTPADVHALPYPDKSGRTVDAVLKELIGSTIKENMAVTGVARFETSNGLVGAYVHHNGKVGAMVQVDGAAHDATKNLIGEVAMHVTAGMPQVPVAVNRSEIPADVIARETETAKEGIDAKKPPEIQQKILTGKLDKVFAEIVLLEQPFVKEEKLRVRELVANASKTAGATLTVARFARFKIGEA